jgi:hypothetical protein
MILPIPPEMAAVNKAMRPDMPFVALFSAESLQEVGGPAFAAFCCSLAGFATLSCPGLSAEASQSFCGFLVRKVGDEGSLRETDRSRMEERERGERKRRERERDNSARQKSRQGGRDSGEQLSNCSTHSRAPSSPSMLASLSSDVSLRRVWFKDMAT